MSSSLSTPPAVLSRQSFGPFSRFPIAALPLFQLFIIRTLVASASWDLGRVGYVGPMLQLRRFQETLCSELSHKYSYIVSIKAMKLRTRDITVKVFLARFTELGIIVIVLNNHRSGKENHRLDSSSTLIKTP